MMDANGNGVVLPLHLEPQLSAERLFLLESGMAEPTAQEARPLLALVADCRLRLEIENEKLRAENRAQRSVICGYEDDAVEADVLQRKLREARAQVERLNLRLNPEPRPLFLGDEWRTHPKF